MSIAERNVRAMSVYDLTPRQYWAHTLPWRVFVAGFVAGAFAAGAVAFILRAEWSFGVTCLVGAAVMSLTAWFVVSTDRYDWSR